jgi:radical SAM superfamily enzyme YgiQ (UPF0313 family)
MPMTLSASSDTNTTTTHPKPVHHLGSKARILLTSVFGPYARDDEYGSRKLNPMELYQNQVTRAEGPFSLRMFHRSWGIMLIQANITAPCNLLDFPTLERFIEEIRNREYDIVGITSILPNIAKVEKMCKLIREYQPGATIVVGGHIANRPGLSNEIDADYVARGEGVRWFRHFLSEDEDAPVRHPLILSGINTRTMGIQVRKKGEVAAALIPSVGCPMGCNFCATSAMFGGKGNNINFYGSGDELFNVMCGIEKEMGARSFFTMDENFLLHRRRALRLLELMEENNKSWSLYVFSSAKVLKLYTIDQLIRLGVSWVWMGLEGKGSQYAKLTGVDTVSLVKMLQSNGIRILGSTIIGLEDHTPENIEDAINHGIRHATDFHQFMLYTPIAGTPFHAELSAKGALLDSSEYEEADIHGQLKFNYRHPHIKDGQETGFILKAFQRDFEINGPSVLRIARTLLQGWQKHKNHPNKRVQARFRWEARELIKTFPATLWAGRKWFEKSNPKLVKKLTTLLDAIKQEIGIKAKLAATLGGRYVFSKLRKEDKFLKKGGTYEPPTFYEMNEQMAAMVSQSSAKLIQWVAAGRKWAASFPAR